MSHTSDRSNPPANSADTHPSAGPSGRRAAFCFEGRKLEGIEGESIAKALFRNGIRTLSRSVKYGRPRGIHCGRGRCAMCQVEVDGVTGVKSCVTPLARGMRINRQHYKPFYSPALTAVMSRIPFPAGFYYRMFTRPRLVRHLFVETIRRMVGVGRIDVRDRRPRPLPPTPVELDAVRARYEVVVVGAGLSGLSAALAAAEAGADVLILDEYDAPGGHSIGAQADAGLAEALDRRVRQATESAAAGGRLQWAPGVTAQGYYEGGRLLAGRESRGRSGGGLKAIRANAYVFATGAQDVIPLFENNDLPGVFGARGLRLFLERDGLVPGASAVVYGTGAELAAGVALLRAWGVRVAAVADTAPKPSVTIEGARAVAGAKLTGVEGRQWIERAVFDAGGNDRVALPCDVMCIAVAGQPSFELAQQAGFRFRLRPANDRRDLAVMVPTRDVLDEGDGPRLYLAGEAAGITDWKQKANHADAAGRSAAG